MNRSLSASNVAGFIGLKIISLQPGSIITVMELYFLEAARTNGNGQTAPSFSSLIAISIQNGDKSILPVNPSSLTVTETSIE